MHCDPRPFKGHDPPPHSSSIKGGARSSVLCFSCLKWFQM